MTDPLGEMLRRWIFFSMTLLTASCVYGYGVRAETQYEKTTVGRVEKVWIKEADIALDAKMDSGTLTSSLDAHDIHVFTEDEKVWVRFVVKDTHGKSITLKRLVVRFARFKKQGHEIERRPVIELGLCIKDVFRNTQINLSNRERFTYPMLIGRRFLSGNVVVDTEKKYTGAPQCDGVTE